VRWALDPLTLRQRISSVAEVDVNSALNGLSFVLLSHQHADHLDRNLISNLRYSQIRWIVPEFLRPFVLSICNLPAKNVITPKLLTPLQVDVITITAFEGMHWEPSTQNPDTPPRGVPSVGYLGESVALVG
jgi:L-ascorbate metabolism protein UlaG (beta-lactamase superfamily)